jgi:hypothetical protein
MPSAAPGIPAMAAGVCCLPVFFAIWVCRGKSHSGRRGQPVARLSGNSGCRIAAHPFSEGRRIRIFSDLYDVDGAVKAFGVRQVNSAIAYRPGS